MLNDFLFHLALSVTEVSLIFWNKNVLIYITAGSVEGTVRSKASKARQGAEDTDEPRWKRMVTGLVCICRVDSQTAEGSSGGEAARSEKGEKEVFMGKGVKSKFSCIEKKHFYIFSLSLSLTNTLSLSQSAYPQLWEFHGISVIACLYLRNALSGLRALLISGD